MVVDAQWSWVRVQHNLATWTCSKQNPLNTALASASPPPLSFEQLTSYRCGLLTYIKLGVYTKVEPRQRVVQTTDLHWRMEGAAGCLPEECHRHCLHHIYPNLPLSYQPARMTVSGKHNPSAMYWTVAAIAEPKTNEQKCFEPHNWMILMVKPSLLRSIDFIHKLTSVICTISWFQVWQC